MLSESEILSENEVYELYRNTGISSENESYIPVTESIDFIITCDDNNLSVIGIEGFYQKGDMIQPDLNIIADFSENEAADWEVYKERCNESAMKFVRKLELDILLNVTLLSEAEWEG